MSGRHPEEGSALIVALLFVGLFGFLTAATLTFSDASLRLARGSVSHQERVYAAESALEAAVQYQLDGAACGSIAGPDIDDNGSRKPVNGLSVDVECHAPGTPGAPATAFSFVARDHATQRELLRATVTFDRGVATIRSWSVA